MAMTAMTGMLHPIHHTRLRCKRYKYSQIQAAVARRAKIATGSMSSMILMSEQSPSPSAALAEHLRSFREWRSIAAIKAGITRLGRVCHLGTAVDVCSLGRSAQVVSRES